MYVCLYIYIQTHIYTRMMLYAQTCTKILMGKYVSCSHKLPLIL